MRKLTRKEIEARMVIYQEIIDHLGMDICETFEEKQQVTIVQKQIRTMADRFYYKHSWKWPNG